MNVPFHYAFKVKDLDSTRKFYIDILKCKEGRSSQTWVDFDFFGHQLSAHMSENLAKLDFCGLVDGIKVPIPHFGCIVPKDVFQKLHQRLLEHEVDILIKPQLRYQNERGEQQTMFFFDFSGNPIEIKCFKWNEEIFQDLAHT